MKRLVQICKRTPRALVSVVGWPKPVAALGVRTVRRLIPQSRAGRSNCCAVLIAIGTIGTFLLYSAPHPVGAHLNSAQSHAPRFTMSAPAANAGACYRGDAVAALGGATGSGGSSSGQLEGRIALLLNLAMMDQARQRLEQVDDYTATFFKQERLDGGDLLDPQVMQLKLRHEPFSVYMKWTEGDVGREVLYVDGQYENRMLVKKGGRMGRLLPSLKLDPHGSLAMGEARHPITEVGLLTLTKKILDYRRRDLGIAEGVTCRMTDNERIDNRECYCFAVEYASPQIDPLYRKTITWIDKELGVPICLKNYTWPDEKETAASNPEIDEETLIEFYTYTDIKLDQRLAASAFDQANTEYTFKR